MSLRLRYHLSFLSLFLGLAAAAVGLGYVVIGRQVAWGLAEESKGNALCLAGFAGQAPATDPAAEGRRVWALASSLSRASNGLTIQWFESTPGGWVARPLVTTPGLNPASVPTGDVLARLERGEAVATRVRRQDAEHDEAIGYAAVPDPAGKLSAIVGVTSKDLVTRTEMSALWRTGAWFTAAAMAASLVLAELITRRVRSDMQALSRGAEALARGEYGHAWPGSPLKELNDLSSTLRSIGRILRDNARQARSHFVHAEQLPSDEEIATACEAIRVSGAETDGAPSFVLRQIGGTVPEDFWKLHRVGSTWYVLAARLKMPQPLPPRIERTLRAHAAADALCGLLRTHAAEAAWRELNELFGIERGSSVALNLQESTIVYVEVEGRERKVSEADAAGPALYAVGTLDAAAMRFASQYLRHTEPSELNRVADELASLLADRGRGVIVAFSTLPSPSPAKG